MNKLQKSGVFAFTIFIFTLVSCNDPIFYTVSQEERPLKPLIAGPSTNFVEFENYMRVAAGGAIYSYRVHIPGCPKNCDPKCKENWESFPAVNERILQLAVVGSKLYARLEKGRIISFSNVSNALTLDAAEITIPGQTIEGIYAANNNLFISTASGKTHSIYYLSGSTPTQISPPSGHTFDMLVGVAYAGSAYYLCNKDKAGIFYASTLGGTLTFIPDSDKDYTGIINSAANKVVAIARGGQLYDVSSSLATVYTGIGFGDRRSTGALGIFKNDSGNLLLAGRQDMEYTITSGYTHGYLEIEFDGAGTITGTSFATPGGKDISSMLTGSNEHYTSSIGSRIVRYIHQVSSAIDDDKTLFASTPRGVWSYRERSPGKFTWNAEN